MTNEPIVGMDISLTSLGMVTLESAYDRTIIAIRFTSENMGLCKRKGGWRLPRPKDVGATGKSSEIFRQARNEFILDRVKEEILSIMPAYVAIEDYGFAGKGAALYLPEITGIIKQWLFREALIPYRLYDPQAIKIYATGRGDARKEEMIEAAVRRFGLESDTAYGKSTNDIADALALVHLLADELSVRADPTITPGLPEETRRVFNRVTKSNPVNILARDFVQRVSEQDGINATGGQAPCLK